MKALDTCIDAVLDELAERVAARASEVVVPRKLTGTIWWKRGEPYVTVSIAKRKRKSVQLACATSEAAIARGRLVGESVARLRAFGASEHVIVRLVEELASAPNADRVAGVARLIDDILTPSLETFGEVADAWTSGELHRDYPSHVRAVDHIDRFADGGGDEDANLRLVHPTCNARRERARKASR